MKADILGVFGGLIYGVVRDEARPVGLEAVVEHAQEIARPIGGDCSTVWREALCQRHNEVTHTRVHRVIRVESWCSLVT
jgi:hypothetical protein